MFQTMTQSINTMSNRTSVNPSKSHLISILRTSHLQIIFFRIKLIETYILSLIYYQIQIQSTIQILIDILTTIDGTNHSFLFLPKNSQPQFSIIDPSTLYDDRDDS